MGVVSNGMLCSGDELRLTADGDGILILPADTPLGVPLADLYGDVVLDVDVKPNRGDALSLVGLAREVAAVTGAPIRFPETEPPETGGPIAERLQVEVAGAGPLPALRGPARGGRDRATVARPRPDAPHRRRPAPGQQRRRREQLRDARARQADPHLRRGRGPRRPDRRATGPAGRAARDARPRRARARPRDAAHRGPGRASSAIAGVMGGAESEITDATTDVIVESAIFDPVSIRRTAFRYALRSEASLRFEKGQEHRLVKLGADRTARLISEWAGGTVATGAVDTDPTRAGRGPRRLPAGPRRPAAGLGRRDDRAARRCSSGSASRRSRRRPARVIAVAMDPQPLDGRPGRGRDARRDRARPGGATSSSRRTWPRRSPASAATTSCRRSCPTPRCRPTVTTRSPSAMPCARRWRARASPKLSRTPSCRRRWSSGSGRARPGRSPAKASPTACRSR